MCPSADIAAATLRGDPSSEPASYEAAAAELERLVAAMEGGQLPLDQLLDSHRRGAELPLSLIHTRRFRPIARGSVRWGEAM